MRFSLRQLLVGFAIASVLLMVYLIISDANQFGRSNRVYNNVRYLTFSPDGEKLAIVHFRARDAGVRLKRYVADVTKSIELVDTATLSNLTIVDFTFRKGNQGPALSGPYGTVMFSSDSKYLRVGTKAGEPFRTWDVTSNCWATPGATLDSNVVDFGHSPDQRWITKYDRKQGTSVWDTVSGKKLDLNTTKGHFFKFSPDSSRMAFSAPEGISIWNLDGPKLIRRFHEDRDILDRVTSIEFSPDNDTLAMRCEEGLRLFSIGTGEENVILPEFIEITRTGTGWGTKTDGTSTFGIKFSPDGQLLAAWGTYGLKFFEMAQGCELKRATVGRISCFEFSPDGKTYATGDWNGKVAIYDTATGRELRSTTLRAVNVNKKPGGLLDAIF